jgi:hypothetical protein
VRLGRAYALASLALAAAAGADARELWRDGEASFDFRGSLRELATLTRLTDADDFNRAVAAPPPPAAPTSCVLVSQFRNCPAFDEIGETTTFTSLTRLRLEFDARANERLSAHVVYDHEWTAVTKDTFERQLGQGFDTDPFVDLDWNIANVDRSEWRHSLYRAYASWEDEHLEAHVGRQRIPWGVGRLWNPLDRFNAIGPLAIEADQSQGVDAVRTRWSFTGFTFAEAIYAAGKRGKDRDFALRAGSVVRDVDVAGMVGVFDEAPTAGIELAGNLGDAAGRMEAVFTNPERHVRRFDSPKRSELPSYWQVVLSIDNNFDVGDGIYVLVEYLYNGNALGFGSGKPGSLLGFFEETDVSFAGQRFRVVASGDVDLFGSSQVVTRSEHLVGTQVGYDLTPELRGDFVVLLDAERWSSSFFPTLRYSPLGWLEISLGVQLFTGTRRSEFGDAEPLGFVLAEAFF